jgi:hypothetical protein
MLLVQYLGIKAGIELATKKTFIGPAWTADNYISSEGIAEELAEVGGSARKGWRKLAECVSGCACKS